MSQPLRVQIQNSIVEHCNKPLFYLVSYDKNTNLATADMEHPVSPVSIRSNEVQGALTSNSARTARNPQQKAYSSWLFLAILEFDKEVSLDEFFMAESGKISLNTGEHLVIVQPVSFLVAHPVRQGSQKGTVVEITFSTSTKM